MISDILFLLLLIHFYTPFSCSSDSFALAILNSSNDARRQYFLYSGDFSQIVFFPCFRMTMSVTNKENDDETAMIVRMFDIPAALVYSTVFIVVK